MIINLLLIALICYYFKRKYENLEIAQNEQAKVLYQLLQNASPQPKVKTLSEMFNIDKVDSNDSESESDTDSESDSDSDSEPKESSKMNEITKIINLDERKQSNIEEINVDTIEDNVTSFDNIESLDNIETLDVEIDKIETKDKTLKLVTSDKSETSETSNPSDKSETSETDYSKMSIKQLKEILSVKGINPTKMKKNEMIELIEKS